jgi:hypothetical protein
MVRAPLACSIVALLGVGCGSASDPGSATMAGLTMDDGGLPLLDDSTSTEAWWLAPPGCEGLLRDEISMAIASLEHGLIAAVDPTGHIICVDTVEAVGEELDELGRHDDAMALSERFEATVVLSHAPSSVNLDRSRYRGDPHPEPNDCLSCGDPHPEPNLGPTRL